MDISRKTSCTYYSKNANCRVHSAKADQARCGLHLMADQMVLNAI